MHLLQVYDIYDTAQLRSHRVGAHVYNMQEYLYKFINFVPVPGLREGWGATERDGSRGGSDPHNNRRFFSRAKRFPSFSANFAPAQKKSSRRAACNKYRQ